MKQITHDTNIELMYKCWAQYIYMNSMFFGLGDPKKVSETLWQFVFYFVLCKKCTGKKKCSLVVVLSLAVIELAKVIKSARGEEEGGWDSLALCGLKAVMGGCTHYLLVTA